MGAYDKDFYAWTIEQAALLRAGRLNEIDLENMAEEIESLGRSTRSELVNRLAVLIAHLLKWQVQPDFQSRSWQLTIEEQRHQVRTILEDNPSLRAKLAESFDQACQRAILRARRETGLDRQAFPSSSPWTLDQVLDRAFYPQ